MKKTLKNLFCGILLSLPLSGYAQKPYEPISITDSTFVFIDLRLGTIDPTLPSIGHPRTPVQIPNVYWNQETGILYFESPCYECTLELVIPGTDTTVYTYSIPDGDDIVQLPTYLSGAYELHIHRGNYCFYATIEL